MLHTMRGLVLISIISLPAVTAAQPIDPWADDPPAEASVPSAPNNATVAPPIESPPTPAPPKPRGGKSTNTSATLHMRLSPRVDPATFQPPGFVDPLPPTEPAEPPPRKYPLELIDRPLVLPAGVTQLGVAYERITFVDKGPLAYGEVRGREASGTPDFNLAHAFSRAELGIGIGRYAYGWVALATQGFPERVQVNAAFSAPQPSGGYAHSQGLIVAHRLWHVPHAGSLVAGSGLQVSEVRYSADGEGKLSSGEVLNAGATLTLQVQLGRSFAFSFGPDAAAPLATSSGLDVHATMGAHGTILIAFHSWDIVANGALSDLSNDIVTFVSLGFRKRWGL